MSMTYPWYAFYQDTPTHLTYPAEGMYELLAKSAETHPQATALKFMGRCTTYRQLLDAIDVTARALLAAGVVRGEAVTVCLPNCPQAVFLFYAINRIGAVANMVHPLSAPEELAFYLKDANSRRIFTLDLFVAKLDEVAEKLPDDLQIVVASIGEALSPLKRAGYYLTRKRPRKTALDIITWRSFLTAGKTQASAPVVRRSADEPAVILYSGGTTGTNKGILLADRHFNACALQTLAMSGYYGKDIVGFKMLAVLPIFHGFGLCICVHMMLMHGCCCLLVPQFSLKTYAHALLKEKPDFIGGVPTLFEALLRAQQLENADLSYLKGVFCGGDSLSVELKRKVDTFLTAHGATVPIREGYGTTECVTASCLTPIGEYRQGSIGIPFPDTLYTITKPDTVEPQAEGEEGEICISGPSVMLGYNHNPEETAKALQRHADGRVWLHTGDLGVMDADGFVYFRQRIKRLIVTSGYNVYPSQVENVLEAHPDVALSCVIGVKDAYKMHRVKAFVVLRADVLADEAMQKKLREHCRRHLARFAQPSEIEFRTELPKTLVGKVAYRVLEEEENKKATE